MDNQTSIALGIAGIVSGVLAGAYTYLKHSKCKCNCLGKPLAFSMDLTPIKIPGEKSDALVDGAGAPRVKKDDDKGGAYCDDKESKV